MNPKYLRTLEFDKILHRLASHAAFSASEELARALSPTIDADEIARRQGETTEARALLDQHPEMSVGGARDVRPLTRNARLNALLAPMDLLDIRQTLLAARVLRRALNKLSALYPRLAARAGNLQELPSVVDAISRAINDRGEILDDASPALSRIRRELNTVRARLMDKLQKIITSFTYAKYLQEPIFTQREGRYVVPIRAEAKGRLPGIVHDTSASGATLFVEPLSVVEMGNRVRELEREEEREIERILRDLTELVGSNADAVDLTVRALAEIDLDFAKAKYAVEIRGYEPVIASPAGAKQSPHSNDEIASSHPSTSLRMLLAMTSLELLDARHPLLDPATVVPNSIQLGNDFSILIITGPNTGGKTVMLKTVGLLALMAQSGLHIPAREGSRLPIFSGIYADIGDEQSIEQSLSTFSSHLKNIVEILREADEHSLVLLDELGAGTDPVEGSALARAILSHLLERKISALVATHYAELKAFAHSTPGVQNASVEFDVETLSPTYHLTMGLPGQSNAFAIAARLGLDAEIIERARGVLARSDVELETMLAEIKRAQQDASVSQAQSEFARRDAEKQLAETRHKLAEVERTRAEILENAREQARAEIQEARAELNRLRQEWRAVSLTREFVENQQDKLNAVLPPFSSPLPPSPSPVGTGEGEGGARGLRLGVGDHVWVERLRQKGTVLSVNADEAEVQVGSFRVHLKLDELGEKISGAPHEQTPSRVTLPEVESPGLEVSLRGLRADDAILQLEKYLDRAYLAGLPYVRIIHGKGTGTLRKLTRDFLREHPHIAEIREAAAHEGGEGVTIARLVSR